ncbi:hypothetical protein [Streptomyces sp. NPDC007346]|uniref:hypothetical protein n=1 Tax=Streptomyces sp. NPDC007346 TaxID=3154682 RepID=UPI0034565BCE
MSTNHLAAAEGGPLTAHPSAIAEALLYHRLKAQLAVLGHDEVPKTIEELRGLLAAIVNGTRASDKCPSE